MKKILFFTVAILFALVSFSQSPYSFKYQTVVRDASGNVINNQDVSFQISILQGSSSGAAVYTETHYITTNDFGLVNLNIGEGNTSDNFSSIDWALGPYYIQVKLDENGGSSFSLMGTSQLLSVPYAMYAKDVENKDDNDADPNNEIQTLSLSNNTLGLTDGGSVSLSQYSNLWQQNGNDIYYNNGWVGVGTDTPSGKMVVQGDATVDPDSALFEVKNKDGQTIFAVYDGGVRIWVDDTGTKANTDKGGFAVGGYRLNKSISNEYLRVTPDSLRMYFDNQTTSGTGHAGGFAIQSFNGVTKSGNTGIMYLQEDNYFIGENSGINLDGGLNNSTFGYEAGQALTNGNNNVFLGYQSGKVNNEGTNNNFIGNQAGFSNTSGTFNNFIGNTSGYSNTTGNQNNFMGDRSGYNNTTGMYNTFIGDDAGFTNTIGLANNFFGSSAGWSNNSGSYNNFIGYQTGYSNVSGDNNNFIGYQAGYNNLTGTSNNFIGYQAGFSNTDGNANNIIGYQAAYNNLQGNENCIYGYQAGYTSTNGNRNIFIGYHAAYNSIGSVSYQDNIMIGDSAGLENGSFSNIFIGNNAGQNNTQYENIYIGNNCAKNEFGGQYNTYVGTNVGINSSGSLNTFIGSRCAISNTTGQYNVFMGTSCGYNNTTGNYNVFIGEYSGLYNEIGAYNVHVGYHSGNYYADDTNTVAIGSNIYMYASNTARIGNGNMTSIGGSVSWSTISDKRYKKNISENVVGLDFIMKLTPVTYNLDLDKLNTFKGKKIPVNQEKAKKIYSGFLAQDVEKAANEVGYDFSGVDKPKSDKDRYGLRYSAFVVPLVKAVQEQQKIIETQKSELELLKQELKDLTEKVNKLESK